MSPCLCVFILLCLAGGSRAQELPTIEWDQATLRLIARGGDYGRMTRLGDGRIGCVYDRGRKMWIRHSSDGARTFGDPILVAEAENCWLTNADLLALRDGTLLYFWNERPGEALEFTRKPAPPGKLTRPFRIRLARSTDHGQTWSEAATLYEAGVKFGDGCWEPAGIELPSGEIQVYFANESPYRRSDEQEISRMISRDGGRLWGDAMRVSFSAKHRDGMPSPLALRDGRIVVAIEDNGLSGGVFKPVIVSTDDGQRWGALKEPLDARWYGGAPFLRQLPSGHVLLSYQESEDGDLHRCRMAVCVGDADAKNFTYKTHPIPLGEHGNQAWNSLFVKDDKTVIAISTATVDGVSGIWAIDGRLFTR